MSTYVGGAIACFGLFQIGAIFALLKKRNDLADFLWGLGFPLACLGGWIGRRMAAEVGAGLGFVEILILVLVSFWALRLSWYVGRRYWRKGAEDARYAKWRREWGPTWVWRSYLQVWILQPLILFMIVVSPLHALDAAPRRFSFLIGLGLAVWLCGFFFEVVGDEQLRRFTSDPANRGKIMDRGLWAWTRHPNYFGESTMWWGLFLMAFSRDAWWIVVSPVTITFLITKVSGVSMLESFMEGRPGWADYKARVPVFFPWPPGKSRLTVPSAKSRP